MTDTITLTDVKTLSALFRERVSRMPDAIAYRHYDVGRQQWMDTSWREMSGMVARWQNAMQRCGLAKGDRVAIMLRNSREWVIFDQAALGLGFVTVPLYIEDRAENAAFILRNSNAKLLVVEGREQWQGLLACADSLTALMHIISVEDIAGSTPDPRLRSLSQWLPADAGELQTQAALEDELASIVYTSGTTGRSKGVMLTHRNILFNAWVSACTVDLDRTAVFLSFLPLSHTLERTIGYYLPMIVGGTVAFNRAVKLLSDDLVTIRPTVLISVPRIYERVYSRITETLQTQSRIKRALFRATLAV
ncbi:MAG TPA: AMP-binding protein, partial [Gammaproteobacteria bacterium]